ncbi:uncharacterized protein LOC122353766 [Puntigrus tetrazona]|uniref:uncharacterized protein LOC122353766 n=1 Tax=Puntigrus tetrazona TaxID=1606681 RepID=UPI001C8A8DC9|nr:uncharacterized protein LOC122353766 [Puntigrus tetrazona]
MPGKFEDADRRRECRRAEYLRDENLRLKAELKEIDRSNLELQKDIKEEKTQILHLSQELRQKKTELEDITAETERAKLKLEEELTTEHEDEVLNAQIKAGIRSMYQMIAPYWKESEAVEDPSSSCSWSDPTTDRHGGFDLLRLRPGPVHPSLDDLAVPSSPRSTISIPNLARTPDRHSPRQPRSPELKRSASLSLPVAWITGAATAPGENPRDSTCCSTCCSLRPLALKTISVVTIYYA